MLLSSKVVYRQQICIKTVFSACICFVRESFCSLRVVTIFSCEEKIILIPAAYVVNNGKPRKIHKRRRPSLQERISDMEEKRFISSLILLYFGIYV